MDFAKGITRIGRLGATYTLGTLGLQVVALLLVPIFTHYLIPAQMGIVRLSWQIMAALAVLVELGLFGGFTSHYFRTDQERRGEFIRSVSAGLAGQAGGICLVLSAAGIWLAPALLGGLPLSGWGVLALWLLIVWGGFFRVMMSLGVRLARLQERAGLSVSIDVANFVLQGGIGVFAVALLGWRGLGRQGTIVIGLAGAAAVAWAVLRRAGGGRFTPGPYKRALRTGVSFLPHNLGSMLSVAANGWLVNKLASSAAMGIYGVAWVFTQPLDILARAILNASYPTFARLMRDGGQEARSQQARLYTLVIAGFAALALGLALFAPVLIKLLVSADYHKAIRLMPVLASAYMFQCLYMVTTPSILFTGKGFQLAAASVPSAVVSIALSWGLIPRFGMMGAAVAMLGCFLVRFAVAARLSQRGYALPWEVWAIVRIVAVGAALGLVDYWLSPRLIWAGAVGLKAVLWLALFGLLWLTGVVSSHEVSKGWQLCAAKVRAWLGDRRP